MIKFSIKIRKKIYKLLSFIVVCLVFILYMYNVYAWKGVRVYHHHTRINTLY